MSPQLAAGLTALVGICMVAGWITAFRNRAYLGLLGLAFLSLSAFFWIGDRASAAARGPGDPQLLALARAMLGCCLLLFLLAAVAAVRETARRLREIRAGYREAEEAVLEMVKASLQKEADSEPSPPEGASENSD